MFSEVNSNFRFFTLFRHLSPYHLAETVNFTLKRCFKAIEARDHAEGYLIGNNICTKREYKGRFCFENDVAG
jgi:hypothetical protein